MLRLGRRGLSAFFFTAVSMLTAQGQSCPELANLRARFMDHGSYEQAQETEQLAANLSQTVEAACRPLLTAHRWISRARAADFGWDPMAKLTRFNEGVSRLDSLVDAHPGEDIYRALRLSVTGTAPRFLGADTHWAEDAEAVFRVSTSGFWSESPKFSEWMVELAQEIQDKTKP